MISSSIRMDALYLTSFPIKAEMKSVSSHVGAGFHGWTKWPRIVSMRLTVEKETKKQEMIMHFLFLACCRIVLKILENFTA